jgi:hypothetical protein
MHEVLMPKQSLKPSKILMTSSSVQTSATRGDLTFHLEPKKGNSRTYPHPKYLVYRTELSPVTIFNPLLTPSRLLDPRVMERKHKALAQR